MDMRNEASVRLPLVIVVHLVTTLLGLGILIGQLRAMQKQFDILQASVATQQSVMLIQEHFQTELNRLNDEDSRIWAAIGVRPQEVKSGVRSR
jgi:hypothetical protein